MARQAKWNKSFWKKMDHLENLEEIAQQPILHIMSEELGVVENVMANETPVRFGGLLQSHYTEIVATPKGYSGRAGYRRTQHINLDPNLPPEESRIDDETNPEVMESLEQVPNRTEQVADINQALSDYADNCRERIKEWFKSEIKNGGK